MGLRIAIFDNNKNILDSLSLLLNTVPDFEVVGIFSHRFDCIKNVRICNPDVVLMDIRMSGMTGLEAVKVLKKETPHIQILMQTVFEDDDGGFDSICAGASDCIPKTHLSTKLIDALRKLEQAVCPRIR